MNVLNQLLPSESLLALGSTALIQVTLVTLLALLLFWITGYRNAARQHAIGMSAIVVILLSPLFAWFVGHNNLGLVTIELATHRPAREHHLTAITEMNTVSPLATHVVSGEISPSAPQASVTTAPIPHDQPIAASGATIAIRSLLLSTLYSVWLVGAILAFLRLVYGAGYQYAFCKSGTPINDQTHKRTLDKVARRLNRPLPPILQSKLVDFPISVGLINPRVILPIDLPEKITPAQLEDVLVHECAHVIRGDLWVGLAQRLTAIIFWLHPLVHMLNRRVALTREELCDNYALATTAAPDYAQTLFDVTNRTQHIHAIPATAALISPTWNLEQRIQGLLDNRRNTMTHTNRWLTFAAVAGFMTLTALASVQGTPSTNVTTSGKSQASDAAQQRAQTVFSKFAEKKIDQMQAIATERDLTIPVAFTEITNAITEGASWGEVSRLFSPVSSRSGQYMGSKDDKSIHTPLWSGPILEMFGAYEQFVNWTPELLELYAKEILSVIPEGSVYFGGTDAGRFVITAYSLGQDRTNDVILTQNALADNTYMDYLRSTYGNTLSLPNKALVATIFKDYIAKVKSDKRPLKGDVTFVDGRAQISGVHAVMDINGMLARHIFTENKETFAFFVEESYVIPWMHAYMEPCGPIMRLNPEPAELTDDILAKDRAYWDALCAKLEDNTALGRDPLAAKAFAKLRTTGAHLYAARKKVDAAEYAFQQAIRLDAQMPEANMGLAQMYVDLGHVDKARDVLARYITLVPNAKKAKELQKHIDTMPAEDGTL